MLIEQKLQNHNLMTKSNRAGNLNVSELQIIFHRLFTQPHTNEEWTNAQTPTERSQRHLLVCWWDYGSNPLLLKVLPLSVVLCLRQLKAEQIMSTFLSADCFFHLHEIRLYFCSLFCSSLIRWKAHFY